MDEKPKTSSSSGQHQLALERQLRRTTPTEVKAARVAFEEAQSASTPPSASDAPPTDRPSSPEIKEMGNAARQLTESVDKICEALVMVFGKITEVSDEGHGQTLVLRSLMRWMIIVAVVQGVVCAVMIFIACTTYRATRAIERTNAAQAETVKSVEALTGRVDNLAKAANETKATVAAVKKTADETATVELRADPDKPGQAVVRILPPRESPTMVPVSASAEPSPTAVEIPVKVNEARTPRPDAAPRP